MNTRQLTLFVVAMMVTLASAQTITGKYEIPKVPEWAKNAVFYQIYPQTFCDSDGDGIGDIQGIISKLDYVKSLGVDAIWFNPFFDSPFHDAGYDIRDYYKIAPRYGTNDDAKQLFEEAHKRGMHVIFDYVISYTAIDHPWFVASQKQEPNKYSNYYIWTETNWVDPPMEFAGQFVKGYGQRNGQFMRNFYWCQPALNFGFANPDPNQKWQLPTNHPDVMAMREDLKNVLRFWMDMGADGFRADMAGALVKTRRVRGNEQFFNTNENETKLFWREIRQLLRILNGVSEGHSYFDAEGKGSISDFLTSYMDQYEKTVGKGYISLPLGNHDNARLGNKRTDKELEIIYAFGFTMPGVPFLYYGNEIGMRQLPKDWPQVEGAYQPRNGARTPMQWSAGKNLGFSSGDAANLYLPVDPAPDAPNVAAQEKNPNSLLNKTRRLIAYPFVYARAAGNDVVLVMLNPRAKASDATFNINVKFKKTRLLAGDSFSITHNKKTGDMTIHMPATSYAIVKLQGQ